MLAAFDQLQGVGKVLFGVLEVFVPRMMNAMNEYETQQLNRQIELTAEKVKDAIDALVVLLKLSNRPLLQKVVPTVQEAEPAEAASQRPRLLNAKELASELRISYATIWRLRKERRIPYFRIGSRVVFDLDKVIDSFREQEVLPRTRRR